MIEVVVLGAQNVIARMKARQSAILAGVERTMRAEAISLVRYIQVNKLQSSPLHHRSGRLQGSIKQDVTNLGKSVLARIYTNVKYAKIHEYGGSTPPHTIVPKTAKALRFTVGGNTVFAKSVNHPGSKMPERSFMRSSLDENREKIRLALQKTVQGVIHAA